MQRPGPTEYGSHFGTYINLVPEEDVVGAMAAQLDEMLALLRPVPEAVGNVRHPPYTWSVKEVVGHLTDAERVFGYRALRFARGDETPLPGFDENNYARMGEFDRCPLSGLVAEFEAVRRSHLGLFQHLPEAAWDRKGVASNTTLTVRALAYVIVGHVRHHAAILRKRLSASS